MKKLPKDQKWHRKKGFTICQKLPTSAKKSVYKLLQIDLNSNLVRMSQNESKWVQTCLHC